MLKLVTDIPDDVAMVRLDLGEGNKYWWPASIGERDASSRECMIQFFDEDESMSAKESDIAHFMEVGQTAQLDYAEGRVARKDWYDVRLTKVNAKEKLINVFFTDDEIVRENISIDKSGFSLRMLSKPEPRVSDFAVGNQVAVPMKYFKSTDESSSDEGDAYWYGEVRKQTDSD